MKIVKSIFFSSLALMFIFSQSSCFVHRTHDNGKHKGWYKNPNNPHHPNSTNPGKGNKKKK